MHVMSLKKEQGEKTKLELIKLARKLFSQNGYNNTRFDEVAKLKGLTTGALYHHFKNKKDLFEKVVTYCAIEISQIVFEQAEKSGSNVEGIINGCLAYIEAVISPKYKNIMLVDSISVLGWKRWKEIDEETSERGLAHAVESAQKSGEISKVVSYKVVARFISGGTNELALWVSESKDKKNRLTEIKKFLENTLNSL